jgi:hypothetical protein
VKKASSIKTNPTCFLSFVEARRKTTTTTKKQGHESKMGTNREENSKGGEERMG